MKSSTSRVLKVAVVGLAAALAGCSSLGGSDLSPGSILSGATRDVAAEQESLERFAVVDICPEVQVRDGTQLLVIFERGRDGDPSAIRFQGTVQKFARECHTDRDTGVTSIKVGVAGRLLAGRSAASGSVTLPVRVALVKNGDELIYSQLHPVEATLPAGQAALTWSKVVEGITIPREAVEARYVIYVGFDEGAPRS